MKRTHYMADCDNIYGDDTLAVTTQEAIDKVNCPTCLDEMEVVGLFDSYDDGYPDDYDPQEDMYWSGTGELMNDDSYIDYLNRN